MERVPILRGPFSGAARSVIAFSNSNIPDIDHYNDLGAAASRAPSPNTRLCSSLLPPVLTAFYSSFRHGSTLARIGNAGGGDHHALSNREEI